MKLFCEFIKCVQYADGTTLYISGDNLNIVRNIISVQLEKNYHWLRLEELSPNIDKTHPMFFFHKFTRK